MRVLIACEFSGTVRDAFIARGHDAWSCDLLPTEKPGPHYQGDVLDLIDGWQPVMFSADCVPDGDGWCEVRSCDPCDCPCLGPTQDGVEYKWANGVMLGRHEDHPRWDLMIAHPPCTYLTNSAEWAFGDGPYHQKVKPETLVGEERRQAREAALAFVRQLLDAPIGMICIENPSGSIGTMIWPASQFIQPYQFGADASKKTGLWTIGLPRLRPTRLITPRIVNGRPRWANQTDSGQNKLSPGDSRWIERSRTYQGIADAMAQQWGTEEVLS